MTLARPAPGIALIVLALGAGAASLRCTLLVDTGDLAGGAPLPDGGSSGSSGSSGGPDSSTPGEDGATPTPVVDAGSGVWPVNNHTYRVILRPGGIKYAAAKQQAVDDHHGYLATITSDEENLFVSALIARTDGALSGKNGPWIGAEQPATITNPSEGWTWVTGEAWGYTAWYPGEPNDKDEKENRINIFTTEKTRMTWGDFTETSDDSVPSFLVEIDP